MILYLVLAACLQVALAADDMNCMPEKFEGQLFGLRSNTLNTIHVDFKMGALLFTQAGGAFTYLNITAGRIYSRNGPNNCVSNPAVAPFQQCAPSDLKGVAGNFGGPNGLAVETFFFKDVYGHSAFLTVTSQSHFPVIYGVIDQATQQTSSEQLYFNLKDSISDPSVFNINLVGCNDAGP